MKESFVFYKSWKEALTDVPDDIRLEVYDCIIEYAFSGKVPSLKPMAKMAFNFIKNDIDRASEKYNKIVDRNRDNGKKGGRPRNPKNPVGFNETQQNPNDNDNEDDNDNDVLLKKETKEENISKENPEELFFEVNPIQEQVLSKQDAEKRKKVAQKKEKTEPPDLDTFIESAREIYQNELKLDFSLFEFAVRAKYQSWIDAGWKDGNKKPIQAWKNKLRNVIPFLKPIYGKSNNQTGTGANNFSTGQTNSRKATYNIQEAAERITNDFANGNIPGVY